MFETESAVSSHDEVIKRLVVDELYWDSRVDASKVMVQVTDGVVTLTGRVATSADRYSAEADARMVDGVVTVENRIELAPDHVVPDPELCENVVETLSWVPDLDTLDIAVSCRNGSITLRGTVPSYWQKLRAKLSAAAIPGVLHVHDELTVVPTHAVSDQAIAHQLARTLEHVLFDDVELIQISVSDGRVTLRGPIPNIHLMHFAQQAAEKIHGVRDIHMDLQLPQSKAYAWPRKLPAK